MPIHTITVDLSRYEHITICSPIWVFRLCSPMQTFCAEAKGKIKAASYVLVHHTNSKYTRVVRHTDAVLGVQHKDSLNIRCRMGRMKRI